MDQRAPLRTVIERFGLRADRRLGQHFLLDPNLLNRIAAAAGDLRGRTVVEVGPGPGGLTRALLDAGAARVIAIERDPRCIAALQELALAADGRLALIEADALTLDLAGLGAGPVSVVANLPYNVGTPLLLRWLGELPLIERMTLMFQREVGLRLGAPPGGRAYGRLSVLVQWLCEVRVLMHLPARAFTPPPQVASSLIQLIPRPAPLAPAPAGCARARAAGGLRPAPQDAALEPQEPGPAPRRPARGGRSTADRARRADRCRGLLPPRPELRRPARRRR